MNANRNKLTFHSVTTKDIPIICGFPQTAEELFFMFPKASYPLTVEQLKASINSRFDSNVVCYEDQCVAFANIYEVVKDQYCCIGNVIVDPSKRGLGIGIYLLDKMIELAIQKYNVKEIRLVCFTTNVNALLFYTKYGFKPYEIKPRKDYNNEQIASIYMKCTMIA